MKTGNKFLMAIIILLIIAIGVLAIVYPDQFVFLLVGTCFGFIAGMVVDNSLAKAHFNQGANMTQELQKKVLSNPAAIMKETRLAATENPSPAIKTQEIPRIKMTGF